MKTQVGIAEWGGGSSSAVTVTHFAVGEAGIRRLGLLHIGSGGRAIWVCLSALPLQHGPLDGVSQILALLSTPLPPAHTFPIWYLCITICRAQVV